MAKRIKVDEIKRASAALKDFQIEHVIVSYSHEDGTKDESIVVLNMLFEDAKAAIQAANVKILKTRGIRNYEKLTLKHTHWMPKFEHKCKHCGKTFTSPIKEQVWCSRECKWAYRKEHKKVAQYGMVGQTGLRW